MYFCVLLLSEPSLFAKTPVWLPIRAERLEVMAETFTPPGTVSIAKRRRANGSPDLSP
jgi:hypothetical protein